MNRNASLVMVLVAVCGVSAFAVEFLGTPTTELNKGQWSIGGEYTYSTQDLDDTKDKGAGTVFDAGGDVADTYSWSAKMKIHDFNVNRYYAVLSYGLTEDWQVSVKLGLTDVKAKNYYEDDPEDGWDGINYDNDFSWGIATKYTFLRQESIDWGISAQMNWVTASFDETYREVGYSDKYTEDIDGFDVLVAVGPTVDMGGWKLYGGPFFYYLDGDADYKYTEVEDGVGSLIEKGSYDVEAASNFGGFIGAQFSLAENTALTTEFSGTGDGWAIGTGITFKF